MGPGTRMRLTNFFYGHLLTHTYLLDNEHLPYINPEKYEGHLPSGSHPG